MEPPFTFSTFSLGRQFITKQRKHQALQECLNVRREVHNTIEEYKDVLKAYAVSLEPAVALLGCSLFFSLVFLVFLVFVFQSKHFLMTVPYQHAWMLARPLCYSKKHMFNCICI